MNMIAVDHDRRGFHRLEHFGLELERRPQLGDVAGVDLRGRVVAASARSCTLECRKFVPSCRRRRAVPASTEMLLGTGAPVAPAWPAISACAKAPAEKAHRPAQATDAHRRDKGWLRCIRFSSMVCRREQIRRRVMPGAANRVRPLCLSGWAAFTRMAEPVAFFSIARVLTIRPTGNRYVTLQCSIRNRTRNGLDNESRSQLAFQVRQRRPRCGDGARRAAGRRAGRHQPGAQCAAARRCAPGRPGPGRARSRRGRGAVVAQPARQDRLAARRREGQPADRRGDAEERRRRRPALDRRRDAAHGGGATPARRRSCAGCLRPAPRPTSSIA